MPAQLLHCAIRPGPAHPHPCLLPLLVNHLCPAQELDYLDGAVTAPKRPFCAIVGGSKVSSKITVIESLLNKVDVLIIG